MNLEEIEDILEDYGLSPYQANAFIAILQLRDASVSEINEVCSVPQPRIYDVLEALDSKGLIETYEKESLRARIYDISTLVNMMEEKADNLASAAVEIEEYWDKPPYSKHMFEIYEDFQQTIRHTKDAIRTSKRSVNISMAASEFLTVRSELKQANKRGVVVNVSLYLDQKSDTDISGLEPYLKETASEARHRKSSAPFLVLVDSHKSYFGVSRPQSGYGMFIQDQALSTILYRYFQDTLWNGWEPIYEREAGEFPQEFSSIRTCVEQLLPYLEEGESFQVSIDGFETSSGRKSQFEGQVVGVLPELGTGVSVESADQVALLVESDSRQYSVGGFGAFVEDIRATRIRVDYCD